MKIKPKVKPYKKAKVKPYRIKEEFIFSGMGNLPKNAIPEIKVRYTRGKEFLGKVTSSKDVAEFLKKVYEQGKLQMQECFIVLYLNQRNEIIGYYRHSVGSITGTLADVRIIFAVALSSLATSIVLSHNHPSGSLLPSEQDKNLTFKFQDAGKLLDINVIDHVIMTKNGYFSFADELYL